MLNFDRSTVRQGTYSEYSKIIATSGFLTALKCTKLVFGRSSAPDPTGGVYSAPPDPLDGLWGLLLSGGEEEEGERERKGGEEGNGRDRPPFTNSWILPCI